MRRSLYFTVLFGVLAVLVPAGAASAGEVCGKDFKERLQCWSQWIGQGTVRVTLDDAVLFDGSAKERKDVEQTLWRERAKLVVEVPKGGHTGAGGTALLLLAKPGARLVDPDATVDQLTPEAVSELASLPVCDPKNSKNPRDLCAQLAKGPLNGHDLIAQHQATDLSKQHAYAIADGVVPESKGPSAPHSTSPPPDDDGKNGSGWDTTTKILAVLCALLVLLLAVLLFLIRRSSQAVGTLSRRALVAPGVGAVPVAATAHTRTPDETTTRLRVTPTPKYGRRVGNVPGPARSAVVRTELHPQGYVELDRVLYRAVWAEPGRPPPAPGGLVDVTDARERDSDVLYAFPPTTGRHAKGPGHR
ncbi:hypothetical protein [Streptomyces sp. NPDC001530]|uniref:hypothetical protein n=1 Tax=Streptomyces sp. NPDC001530 TaxID=3364582 RepID=UPI0036990A1B